MIRLEVMTVSHQKSSTVNTTHIAYPSKDGVPSKEVKTGAEWEEVELKVVENGEPTIQIANIAGDAFLAGGSAKLIINKPEFFGFFEVGDVIPLVTPRTVIK